MSFIICEDRNRFSSFHGPSIIFREPRKRMSDEIAGVRKFCHTQRAS
ncbi:hypothetical protein FOQG_02165 [Fusarium oxysporum f. sp. raphani 54005]|uniref:Uncharacterized protein n=4 Tax=Fusarium oxysporum TaxID=5507 RepID=X0CRI0_FUSOX|nr:hypothetical protein FOVG_07212 [Fusarium oxysporum f. sp. pisi HDV247]EXK96736.1 hypothetical protein FOQG_02165 [Fusarium oxysporum f. sp. raphani 54005]EXL82652.1 hypothetical protein FOPG_04473 [Fusarium oxysporum f. sp. conglutinans race 2 54008]EXM34198.1 hypothetical protein FOTG_02612 [Fusarium oxysporum f. sp. vasinfectum 25433]